MRLKKHTDNFYSPKIHIFNYSIQNNVNHKRSLHFMWLNLTQASKVKALFLL